MKGWYQDSTEGWANDELNATIDADENGFTWALWRQYGGTYMQPPDWDIFATGTASSLIEAQAAAERKLMETEEEDRKADEALIRELNDEFNN